MPPPRTRDAASAVIRLHPIRVLVAGTDSAFCERALAVLAELGPVGCTPIAPGEGDELVAIVHQERPDVVVLDASGREAAAGRVIVALAETAPEIGVVVVCEQATPAARKLGALPKWGWTQDLRSAVERASVGGRRRLPDGIAAVADGQRPPGPLAGWAEDGPRV